MIKILTNLQQKKKHDFYDENIVLSLFFSSM